MTNTINRINIEGFGMKQLSILGLASSAILALGLVCSTAHAAETVNVRYSWKLKGEYAGFYIAKEQGLFTDRELDVHLGEGAGAAAALTGLLQGNEDVVVVPAVFALSAIAQGMPVKVIALYHPATPLGILSFSDAPVNRPADMQGKSIPHSPGDTVTSYLPVFCEINKIDCDTIQLVSVSTDARVSQFMTHRIDMLGTYLNVDAPALDAMVDEPLVRMELSDYGLVLPGLSLVTSTANIEQKPEVLKAFIAAVNEGIQASKDDPAAAAQALAANWPAPPAMDVLEQQIKATNDAIPVLADKPLGWVDEAELQKALDLLSASGELESELPVDQYYTNVLLP
jgi:NitT/TauT family transport system substrate-binding protein